MLVFASALAVPTDVDRVCISKAETSLTDEFKLTALQMGTVFAAFTWGHRSSTCPAAGSTTESAPRKS